jgi:Na+/H+ antiporter NhaC
MKKAYDRVATTGMVYSTDSVKYNLEKDEDVEGGNLWFFAAPILLLIAITINTNDLLYGVLAGIGLSMAMILIGRKLKFVEVSDAILTGLGNMIPMLAIIVAALAIKISMDQINLPNYIIEAVLPYMQPALFPMLTFILVAGLAFITGSNWGIPAVCVPILMPLALAGDANIILTASAIVSGGVFGSHACFYSDCTVLTSAATKIEVMEHNLTQIPYAIISAVMAIILFAVFGIMDWSF